MLLSLTTLLIVEVKFKQGKVLRGHEDWGSDHLYLLSNNGEYRILYLGLCRLFQMLLIHIGASL